MTVSIADPWQHVGAGVVSTMVLLLFVFKGTFKRCWADLRHGKNLGVLLSCGWQLRWYIVVTCIAFVGMSLLVASHQAFVGLHMNKQNLVLDYAWPRSDISVNWTNLAQTTVEARRFRFRYMYRLQVRTGTDVYRSAWAGPLEVRQAKTAIETYIPRPGTAE
jgi:hypothetical protein